MNTLSNALTYNTKLLSSPVDYLNLPKSYSLLMIPLYVLAALINTEPIHSYTLSTNVPVFSA